MPESYLHERADFIALLRILEQETGIQIQLIEKDYWIMHVLYGLKKQGLDFELKGGHLSIQRLSDHPPIFGGY
jgi:predicted nucleotidyltransferase component of viral defense system